MIKHLVIAAVAVAGISLAGPASAQGVGVGVGPNGVGVTVGTGRGDYDRGDRVVREREVIREREPRRSETVIIKKDRDYDRRDRRVIIDRD